MVLQCFTWIAQLLGHTDDDDGLEGMLTRLPDCLRVDILSRLQQIDLLVSKALISSQYFSTLHLKRARPVLIIQCDRCFISNEQNLFVFDESLNKEEEKMFEKVLLKREVMINKASKDAPHLRYSCEGVLLFTAVYDPPTYVIFNPITQEEVTVQHRFNPGYLCAFYYCSSTREFKLLYARVKESRCQYSIYSVRTQTWGKIHCPSPNLLPDVSPAIVNGAVHLLVCKDMEKPDTPPCAKGIMVLNIDKEELSHMPHPGTRVCSSRKEHGRMSLLVKDESLSFCQLNIFEHAMDIWMLEDYESWLWTKRCKVNLVFDNQGIHHAMRIARIIEPLHFLDGELVYYWFYRGLFMYNLDHNTLRNIQGPQVQGSKAFTCKPYKKSLLTIA